MTGHQRHEKTASIRTARAGAAGREPLRGGKHCNGSHWDRARLSRGKMTEVQRERWRGRTSERGTLRGCI